MMTTLQRNQNQVKTKKKEKISLGNSKAEWDIQVSQEDYNLRVTIDSSCLRMLSRFHSAPSRCPSRQ